MSKQTMVMVLSEHGEIYWNHKTGESCCDGCDAVLCDLSEDMGVQELRLRGHQADQMLSAGLGLTRPAEAEAWQEGFESGMGFAYHESTPSGVPMDPPGNPYT